MASLTDGEQREVLQAARYIERTTNLREKIAKALAYRHAGFSQGGIAKQMDTTKGTVSNYMDRVVAEYGIWAEDTKGLGEAVNLERVTNDDIADYHPDTAREYIDRAKDHAKFIPGPVLDKRFPNHDAD